MFRLILAGALSAFAMTAHADGLSKIGLDDPEVLAPVSDWTGPYIGLSYGSNKSTRSHFEEGYDYREATCTRGTTDDNHANNKCRLDQALFDALDAPLVNSPWDVAPYQISDGVLTDQLAKYNGPALWLGDDADGVATWRLGEDAPDPDVAALNAAQGQNAVLSVMRYFQEGRKVTQQVSDTSLGGFLGYRKDFGRIVGGAELSLLGDMRSAELQVGLDLNRLLIYGLAGAGQHQRGSGTLYGAGADFKLGERMFVGAEYVIGDFQGTDVESASLRVALRF